MTASIAIERPATSSFTPGDWAILARRWHPVAAVATIGEKPLGTTLLDVRLVVYRTSLGIRVARDLCPHRGVPLSMGWVEEEEIVCAYHGLRFGPDGGCRRIPAHPGVVPSPLFALAMVEHVERYGLVWCRLVAEGDAALPAFPAWDDPAYQQILPPSVDIAAAAGRQVEGFVDVAHFAWVHHEAFAEREDAVVPLYSTQRTEYGQRTEYRSGVSNFPKALKHLNPPGFQWLRVFDVFPPFVATLTVHFPREDRLHIMNAASPVAARLTRLFVPILRNFDTNGPLEDVYAFNAQIFAEDQAIVEAQHPEDLPLNLREEAHFAADLSSVGYRKLLRGMGLSLQQSA